MKTVLKLTFLFLVSVSIIGCKKSQSTEKYLKEVLDHLEKIESATYYTANEGRQPGDTTTISAYHSFVKEYNNPADSTIGASFVILNADDTTKFEFGYDGHIRTLVYHDVKGIVVDDFTVRRLPFRPLTPPFFNYTQNIIKYILTTEDSIQVELKDLHDSKYVKLVINEDKQVEFFGKAHYMPDNPYNFGETTSIYELWISKSNHLPYKVRREMPYDISVTTCSDIITNNLSINDFNVYDYFPADYEIRDYGQTNNIDLTASLTGKKAPDWTLSDMHEQKVSLSDFKSKVLLINFTGIGCGPCQASVPFLKTLRETFSEDEFELIAIESWARKAPSLQHYSKKNKLNYNLLSATNEVIKSYQTGGAAPAFFVLDNQRVVRKIFKGYSKETTDNEIMNAIKELLAP